MPPSLHQSLEIGRPAFEISEDSLTCLLETGFTVGQTAQIIGVSKSTVERRMHDMNISVRSLYASLSDNEIDGIVAQIWSENPSFGICYLVSFFIYFMAAC